MGKRNAVTLESSARPWLNVISGVLAGAAVTFPVSVEYNTATRGYCDAEVSVQEVNRQRLDRLEAGAYKWRDGLLVEKNAFFQQVRDQRHTDGTQDSRILTNYRGVLNNARRIDDIERGAPSE